MKVKTTLLAALMLVSANLFAQQANTPESTYEPTPENLEARKHFADSRFGIFLHWGIYSMFAQGEWYLNTGNLNKDEYAKAASGFYPIRFDADKWVKAFKDAGARYITFTTRHHDGFSMYHTAEGKYNIVDATPFERDVLKELTDACHREGIDVHLYYSILDWIRPDYPIGRTGRNTGRTLKPDYPSYFGFMERQLNELLTGYGDVKAIWLDGYWDHDEDSIPFDWHMPDLYRYVHSIKPECLIGNNHHIYPLVGEDFQMFERDLPGENKSGLSGQDISLLPLEMCETMNGMWGYKVSDTNYKSASQLIQMIVRSAAKGSNLLLNIGPQPNGELPEQSLDRLKSIGQWMRHNGSTIYGTQAGSIAEQPWGVSTDKADTTFVHVLSKVDSEISFPLTAKPRNVLAFEKRTKLPFKYDKKNALLTIKLNVPEGVTDYIIRIEK